MRRFAELVATRLLRATKSLWPSGRRWVPGSRESAERAHQERTKRGRLARRRGKQGERLAKRHLKRAGYRFVVRNLRTPRGEIDLIFRDGPCLVVVEVKCGHVPAQELLRRIHGEQRARLRRAAQWVMRQTSQANVRIDVVLVVMSAAKGRSQEIFWLRNAIRPSRRDSWRR